MREIKTPIMLKMEVSPLAMRKSSMPVEHAVQGRNEDEFKQGGPPKDAKSEFFYYCSWINSARPREAGAGRQQSRRQLAGRLILQWSEARIAASILPRASAPSRVFLVEGLLRHSARRTGDVERLDELMIVARIMPSPPS